MNIKNFIVFKILCCLAMISSASAFVLTEEEEKRFQKAIRKNPRKLEAYCFFLEETSREFEKKLKTTAFETRKHEARLTSAAYNLHNLYIQHGKIQARFQKLQEDFEKVLLTKIVDHISFLEEKAQKNAPHISSHLTSKQFQGLKSPYIKSLNNKSQYMLSGTYSLPSRKEIRAFPENFKKVSTALFTTLDFDDSQEVNEKVKKISTEIEKDLKILRRLQKPQRILGNNKLIIEEILAMQERYKKIVDQDATVDLRYDFIESKSLVHSHVFLEWFNNLYQDINDFPGIQQISFSVLNPKLTHIPQIPDFEKRWDKLSLKAQARFNISKQGWKNFDKEASKYHRADKRT